MREPPGLLSALCIAPLTHPTALIGQVRTWGRICRFPLGSSSYSLKVFMPLDAWLDSIVCEGYEEGRSLVEISQETGLTLEEIFARLFCNNVVGG